MRLKSLEIKGFKSFANQTVVNFEQDVIGIVGPNGSGKSNIVDAIRWVLGEQKSRELRLDSMSSVIFNGTKKRKPSGAASVSLTFENTRNLLPTEYHAVTITRILYRSGESEYRLNGVTCRLKDITSLFLDTGIGSNSYAIIALGMVDDILADKDNARRKMFEQAAGISKYKVRKRETLNKLKNTSDDLERIEDLLHEISANLKSLEKQARRTKRYFELKEQYKALSMQLAQLRIGALKTSHRELKQKIEQEQDNYRSVDARVITIEAELEQQRKANLDKERALSERQRILNERVGRIRGMENDRKMLTQKQQFVEENRNKLDRELQEARQRLTQLQDDIEEYRSDLNMEKRIEARQEQELITAEEQLARIRESHGALKSDLDNVVAEQQDVERAVYELEKQKAVNRNNMSSNQFELERNNGEIEKRQHEIQAVKDKVTALEQEEQRQQQVLTDLEQVEEQRKAAVATAEAQLDRLNQQMSRVSRELDAKRNEYKLTKSMVENLEGFPESIKFLSNNKDWKQDVPLLSDLIFVQEEYRVAIENYLNPYLNYYVVENLEDARKAIQLLGRSQKGKANFFILDAFRDYTEPMTLVADTQRAIDLVQVDRTYYNLCAYLLENVLITEREDFNSPLPESDVVLLSRSGRLTRKRFSVSGGSIGLFEGKKIGRKKNLEYLDEAIQRAEREENKLSTAYYNLKEKLDNLKRERSDAEIQQQKNLLHRIQQDKVSFVTRLENFESFVEEVNEKNKSLQTRIDELTQQNGSIEQQLAQKQQELAQIKERISDTDVSYRELAEQLSAASGEYNDKNIKFIQQENKVASLQRELSFREKQLQETSDTLQKNEQGIQTATRELHEIDQQVLELQEQLQRAYTEKKSEESLLTEAEQIYYQARGAINELEDEARKQTRKQQDLQVLINQLKEKFNDVKHDISSIAQRLRIEFEIDVNELINREDIPELEGDEQDLEGKVERLKQRLSNYGEINPLAVEAYDEMKERHDTITQQRDDIIEAKQSLEKTIEEIEETATLQFLDAFEQVRLYFIEVFRNLFTENDACDLILLDPEHPLESKIEIVAKPRGKRPQTISQLSGGEKTLTATALLFALYLLKPAPFCIFDEVDAPLDDANIIKFNRIIKKFSKDSQFIIVTHNKLTMAAVDTIYGVYMGEQGVSGVMPVDFRDYENTASFEAAVNN